MSTRRWYAPVLVVAVTTITIGAVYSFGAAEGLHIGLPFLKAAKPAGSGRKTVARKNVAANAPAAVPSPATPVTVADAATVESDPVAKTKPRKPALWTPSERQKLRDQVYLA